MLLYASISLSLYLMQISIAHNLINKSQSRFFYINFCICFDLYNRFKDHMNILTLYICIDFFVWLESRFVTSSFLFHLALDWNGAHIHVAPPLSRRLRYPGYRYFYIFSSSVKYFLSISKSLVINNLSVEAKQFWRGSILIIDGKWCM